MPSGTVTVDGLTKTFGDHVAVDDLEFEIDDGEFFTFLGPSGCGKTTTLRMLAGFESPSDGRIRIGDSVVTDDPPYDRDVGMVFQSYALFPHKTVLENVAFGLKMEGIPKADRRERAREALELVNLSGFGDRTPTDLSGGQQQRVALARALVIEPDVLLLDEPLANLDLKLRQQMRLELKRIQDELGITTVYVTHDQQEAFSMSDRILVMNDGHEEQTDSPVELYNRPSNEFVADFLGEANLLSGSAESVEDGAIRVELTATGDRSSIVASEGPYDVSPGDSVVVNVRPENVDITDAPGAATVSGEIIERTFYGQNTTFHVEAGEERIRVDSFGRARQSEYDVGDEVGLEWSRDDCLVLRGDSP